MLWCNFQKIMQICIEYLKTVLYNNYKYNIYRLKVNFIEWHGR